VFTASIIGAMSKPRQPNKQPTKRQLRAGSCANQEQFNRAREVVLRFAQDFALRFLVGWRGLLIALMMEAVSTSETSVNIYQTTRRNIPEDSHLLTGRREEVKSQSCSSFQNCYNFVSLPNN
jgi:hypothetical protein